MVQILPKDNEHPIHRFLEKLLSGRYRTYESQVAVSTCSAFYPPYKFCDRQKTLFFILIYIRFQYFVSYLILVSSTNLVYSRCIFTCDQILNPTQYQAEILQQSVRSCTRCNLSLRPFVCQYILSSYLDGSCYFAYSCEWWHS